jgi:hypothetical protein
MRKFAKVFLVLVALFGTLSIAYADPIGGGSGGGSITPRP